MEQKLVFWGESRVVGEFTLGSGSKKLKVQITLNP